MVTNANSLWLFWAFLEIISLFGSLSGANFPVMAIAPEYPVSPKIEREMLPLSVDNIEQRSRAVTVRVIASEKSPSGVKVSNAGSGILISKRNNTYFVITNNHVLKASTDIQVATSDDKSHMATLVNTVSFPSIDLVLISFQSQVVYPTARLGRTSDLKIGDWVFATGFPRRSQAWKFAEGQYALAAPKTMELGYAFGYSSAVEIGMSGGAVMDAYGRVIAVNGMHSKPLWGKPSYVYANGEKPCETIREEMANLSWAIPMETVIQFMPDLRVASLDIVQTKDNFPNPFAANHPSSEFWQWRSSSISKCVPPISPFTNISLLNNVSFPNAALPILTFSSRSLYSSIYPKLSSENNPSENNMSELSFLNFNRLDSQSLVNTVIAFSFGFTAPLVASPTAIAQTSQQPISQSVRITSEADQRAQAQIYLSQAQTLFEQGQYDRSMMLVNQAIDVNSNNPLAWQLLGNCFKKMGRDQDALTAYDQAIRLLSVAKETAIAPANINSGNINPNPNNYNNPNNSPQVFIQPTNQSMNQSTSDIVQLWTERARTLDRLNRFQESVTAYDQALKIRCQEQALRTNEPLPTFCQPYLFPSPTTPNNSNRDAVIVPVSPSGSSQSPTQSKPNRSIW